MSSPAAAGRPERASSVASSVATDASCRWNPNVRHDYEELDRDLLTLGEKFYDALDGPFAVCGGDKALRHPVLTLAGHGTLKDYLPAQSSTGRYVSDQSPVIARSINLQDQDEKSIEHAWTLDATRFTIDNKAWHEGVERVVAKAARELNITVPVKARLQSLRIYQANAKAQDLFDTSRRRGVVGSLLITLGRSLRLWLKYGREKKANFLFDGFKPELRNYCAWFSEVSQDFYVDPMCGYETWAVMYDLVVDLAKMPNGLPATLPSAKDRHGSRRALADVLGKWNRFMSANPDLSYRTAPTYLVHILETPCSLSNLSLEALLPSDARKVRDLRAACCEHGLDVFLAMVQRVWEGPRDFTRNRNRSEDSMLFQDEFKGRLHEAVWNSRPSTRFCPVSKTVEFQAVRKIEDDGGKYLMSPSLSVPPISHDVFRANLFMQHEPWGWIPDKEKIKRPTNAESVIAEQTWQRLAVCVVPRASIPDFFERVFIGPSYSRQDEDAMSQFVLDTYLDASTRDEAAYWNVVQLVSRLLAPVPEHANPFDALDYAYEPSGNVRGKMLQYAFHQGDLALFQKIAGRDDATRPANLVQPEVFGWMRKNAHPSSLQFEQIREIVLRMIMLYPSFAFRFKAVLGFCPPDLATIDLAASQFASDVLGDITERSLLRTAEDGRALVDAARYYYKVPGHFTLVLLPLLKSRMSEEGFVIGFARHFLQHSTANVFHGWGARDLFLSLAEQNASEPSHFLTPQVSYAVGTERRTFSLAPGDLAGYILDLASLDCADVLGRAVGRIVSAVSSTTTFKSDDYKTLWLPFLHDLLDLFASNFVPLSPLPIGQLFKAILQHYALTAVGMQPLPHNGDWRMSGFDFTHRGPCIGCDPIEEFLKSPERIKAFKIPSKQKEHVMDGLRMSRLEVTVDKSSRPFTTTIRKKGNGDEEDFRKWEERRETAREVLAKFDDMKLRTLLGTSYQEIMDMDGIMRGGGDTRQATNPSDHVVSRPNGHTNTVAAAGTKRRADAELDANRTAPVRVQSSA